MGVPEDLSPTTYLALGGVLPISYKAWVMASWDEKIVQPEPLNPKLLSTVSETSVRDQGLHSVPSLSLQTASQTLEDFLEKYLDENLLDAIEPEKLATILSLVRRLKSSLAETMIKNCVEYYFYPSDVKRSRSILWSQNAPENSEGFPIKASRGADKPDLGGQE